MVCRDYFGRLYLTRKVYNYNSFCWYIIHLSSFIEKKYYIILINSLHNSTAFNQWQVSIIWINKHIREVHLTYKYVTCFWIYCGNIRQYIYRYPFQKQLDKVRILYKNIDKSGSLLNLVESENVFPDLR